MNELTPTPKVTAATVAGAITTILFYILAVTGVVVNPPAVLVAAVTLLVTVAAGYLKRDKNSPVA